MPHPLRALIAMRRARRLASADSCEPPAAKAVAVAAAVAAILAAGLAGCAHIEDAPRPPAPIPATWPAHASADGGVNATLTGWRTFFRDPRLQALIASALANNRDLRIMVARVEEARAQYGIVSADRFPSANLSGSGVSTKFPAELAGSGEPIVSRRAEFSLSAVSFELDFWGRVASLSEGARARLLATEDAQRALRISLIAEIANLYFSGLELDERVALAREQIATREKTRALIQRGMELGAAARPDVLMADAALHTARAELAILENQRAAAQQALLQLVGQTPPALPAGRALHEQDVRGDLAPGIPSEAIILRPDVLGAENRLREARANVAAARAAFFPRILLTASLGLASRSLAGLFGAGAGNWSFQPSLSQPLFDGGRTAGYVDIAVARQDAAVADYEKTIQQAFREIADLLSTRASLAEQRQAGEATVRAQEERLLVAQARFQAGSLSQLDILDAQRELLGARQALTQVRRAQLSTSAQLYKALGGGNVDGEG